MAERREWFEAHGERHPVTVALAGGAVVGWGALSPFRGRWGYRHTVENSVYVRHDLHRRGVGRALLLDLIDRARFLGHHTIIAGIDGEQAGSVAYGDGRKRSAAKAIPCFLEECFRRDVAIPSKFERIP